MNIFPNNRMRMAAVKRILCLVITIVISLQAVPFASADESPEDAEYARAFEQGYVALSRKETDPGEPVSSAEYKAMLADLITQIHPESLEWFNTYVKDYDAPLTREFAILMSWYAASCVGADTINSASDYNPFEKDEFGEDMDSINIMMNLLPEVVTPHELPDGSGTTLDHTEAMLWNVRHISPYSGKQVIPVDEAAGNLRNLDPFLARDAVLAVCRIADSAGIDEWAGLPEAALPAFTEEQLRSAAETDVRTMGDLPRLTGFVLTNGYGYGEPINKGPADIRRIANWGFTSARINVPYEALFSEDCTQVNLTELKKLDALVAAAADCRIHLNITLMSLPGRTRWQNYENFTSSGDFDLFVNPDKQALADQIWRFLAARYRDIPGAYLSFTPFWEADNPALSTGSPAPEYGRDDVIRVLDLLCGAIREEDPDRFLIYEVNAGTEIKDQTSWTEPAIRMMESKYDNTLVSYNYGDGTYIYADMPDSSGSDIDMHTHSIFKPEYPVYIYAARKHLEEERVLVLDGFLPAGTRINFYLESTGGGELTVTADENVLARETLQEESFPVSPHLSMIFSYATSDRNVSVELDRDTGSVTFACRGGWVEWSGMDVVLPEEYAVERWYSYSAYDAYADGNPDAAGVSLRPTSTVTISPRDSLDGERITIHEDVTFTSEHIMDQSSLKVAMEWTEATAALSPSCLVRFESAIFSTGTMQDSILRYYDDILSAYDRYGFNWYSNDYDQALKGGVYGAEMVPCDGFGMINMELLELLIRHQ